MRFLLVFLCLIFSISAEAYESSLALYEPAKYPENFTHFEYASPNAVKGGRVVYDYQLSSFDSFNPFIIVGNAMATPVSFTFDSLMKGSLDEIGVFYPLIASHVELSKKRDYIKFKINPNAKFHNNKPIEARDVIFTIEILKKDGSPSYKESLRDIGNCNKINACEMGCKILNPNNLIAVSSLVTLPILSKEDIENIGFADNTKTPFLGSGAYKIGKYKFNSYMILERVKEYWGADLPVNKGQYNFDQIKYDVYSDSNMVVEALKTGLIDFREENIAKTWAKYDSWKSVKDGKLKKVVQENANPANLQFFAMNMRRKMFQDLSLRKAMNIAFDFDWMNQKLFHSSYKRLFSHYENTQFAARGELSLKEKQILRNIDPKSLAEIENAALVRFETGADALKNRSNLENALNLLKEAGYKLEGEKLISPITNLPVEIEYIYNAPASDRILIAYQKNLKKLGINFKIRLLDQAQYAKRMEDFDYDMIGLVVPGFPIPGFLERQLWHSSSDIKGGYNLSGIRDDLVDKLVEKIESIEDMAEKKIFAKLLDRVLMVRAYTVLQYYSKEYRTVYWDKFERPEVRPLYAIGTETWWKKTE